MFSLLHGHPQLQVLLHWLIIISHGLLINVFGFLHAHSNSPYFSKVKFMILFFSLPFSLKGEQCLVKNALGTISIVEQLVQHKHDFVLTAGPGLGICCMGTKQPMGKQDKGRRGKASLKTHTLSHINRNPTLSLLLQGFCEHIRTKHSVAWKKTAASNISLAPPRPLYCCLFLQVFQLLPFPSLLLQVFQAPPIPTPTNSITKEVNHSLCSQLS